MIDLGFFGAEIVRNSLDTLLEVGDEAILSFDSRKLFLMISQASPAVESVLTFRHENLDHYSCDQEKSMLVNLVKLYTILEHQVNRRTSVRVYYNITTLDESSNDRLYVENPNNALQFELYNISENQNRIRLRRLKFVEHGYVNRHEDHKYKVTIRLASHLFRRILDIETNKFWITIRRNQMEISGHGIRYSEEAGECRIEGPTSYFPCHIPIDWRVYNKGSFLKGSNLSEQVNIHAYKTRSQVAAMFEFPIPPVGIFMVYGLKPDSDK